jgi:hypothetical protein
MAKLLRSLANKENSMLFFVFKHRPIKGQSVRDQRKLLVDVTESVVLARYYNRAGMHIYQTRPANVGWVTFKKEQ